MMKQTIDKVFNKYILHNIVIVFVLTAIAAIPCIIGNFEEMRMPIIISSLFSLITMLIIAYIWRWVTVSHEENLPNFHTFTSVFRMLAALAVMTVYCLIVGRDNMTVFVIIFMGYYFGMLVNHSLFFTRINSQKEK